jgi:hypothetical protein
MILSAIKLLQPTSATKNRNVGRRCATPAAIPASTVAILTMETQSYIILYLYY